MARHSVSTGRIQNVPPLTSPDNMTLATISASGFDVAATNTKFQPANGVISDTSLNSGTDMSLPANGLVAQCYAAPVSGTISQALYRGTLPTLAQTFTLTLMKNGVATGIVIIVSAATNDGHGNGYAVDSVHSVSVVYGDLLSWRIVNSAGAIAYEGAIFANFRPN